MLGRFKSKSTKEVALFYYENAHMLYSQIDREALKGKEQLGFSIGQVEDFHGSPPDGLTYRTKEGLQNLILFAMDFLVAQNRALSHCHAKGKRVVIIGSGDHRQRAAPAGHRAGHHQIAPAPRAKPRLRRQRRAASRAARRIDQVHHRREGFDQRHFAVVDGWAESASGLRRRRRNGSACR